MQTTLKHLLCSAGRKLREKKLSILLTVQMLLSWANCDCIGHIKDYRNCIDGKLYSLQIVL
jgi:hypothetical protein